MYINQRSDYISIIHKSQPLWSCWSKLLFCIQWLTTLWQWLSWWWPAHLPAPRFWPRPTRSATWERNTTGTCTTGSTMLLDIRHYRRTVVPASIHTIWETLWARIYDCRSETRSWLTRCSVCPRTWTMPESKRIIFSDDFGIQRTDILGLSRS